MAVIINGSSSSPGVSASLSRRVLQTTGSPFAVSFSDMGAPNMSSNSYSVALGGETLAEVRQSSITPAGFTIIGGHIGDIHHVIIGGN